VRAPLVFGYDLDRTGGQLYFKGGGWGGALLERVGREGGVRRFGGIACGLNDASGGDFSFLASAGAASWCFLNLGG
jgi:hypothetical protein